jgi:antitoxin FitA
MISLVHIDISEDVTMSALTIRNLPDDVHEGLRALAASHGRSAEAEVRDLIINAVKPEARTRPGDAMAAIWRATNITAEEVGAIKAARSTEAAVPIDLS